MRHPVVSSQSCTQSDSRTSFSYLSAWKSSLLYHWRHQEYYNAPKLFSERTHINFTSFDCIESVAWRGLTCRFVSNFLREGVFKVSLCLEMGCSIGTCPLYSQLCNRWRIGWKGVRRRCTFSDRRFGRTHRRFLGTAQPIKLLAPKDRVFQNMPHVGP